MSADQQYRSTGEFDLIRRYFSAQCQSRPEVLLGIGDDAAILRGDSAYDMVISVDTLIDNVHFPSDAPVEAIGYKALAVNLSDMAAMGAEPVWVTLAITLPVADQAWVEAYLSGFNDLAARYGVALIGGDTTCGPLAMSVQIGGKVPKGSAITRSGARVGDRIGVTGKLGDAAGGLVLHGRGVSNELTDRLHRPSPRVEAGLALRGIAHASIDISDGLAADLGHILQASKVGARVHLNQLPVSSALRATFPENEAYGMALSGGDDYELCFTVPKEKVTETENVFQAIPGGVTWIGEITAGSDLKLLDSAGNSVDLSRPGFDHFGSGR